MVLAPYMKYGDEIIEYVWKDILPDFFCCKRRSFRRALRRTEVVYIIKWLVNCTYNLHNNMIGKPLDGLNKYLDLYSTN